MAKLRLNQESQSSFNLPSAPLTGTTLSTHRIGQIVFQANSSLVQSNNGHPDNTIEIQEESKEIIIVKPQRKLSRSRLNKAGARKAGNAPHDDESGSTYSGATTAYTMNPPMSDQTRYKQSLHETHNSGRSGP